MMGTVRQHGGVGIMILMLMVLLMVGYLASYTLYRVTTSGHERDSTQRLLAIAAEALDQFAAANARLPCPADPTIDTGLEDPPSATTCSSGGGTIPWKTLGMNHADAIDGWGRKLSYRVYDGPIGLTQPSGVSMVECDTVPGGGATGPGGLCKLPPPRTGADMFLLGKGLAVSDFDANPPYVAYVVISHGATGLGGYTVSGARLDLPSPGAGSYERNNTSDTGPFTIKAFSDPDISATVNTHFDDLLVYRTLPDLAQRAGLSARNWP